VLGVEWTPRGHARRSLSGGAQGAESLPTWHPAPRSKMMASKKREPRGSRHGFGFTMDLAAGSPIEALRAGGRLGAGSGQGPMGHGEWLASGFGIEFIIPISTDLNNLE